MVVVVHGQCTTASRVATGRRVNARSKLFLTAMIYSAPYTLVQFRDNVLYKRYAIET